MGIEDVDIILDNQWNVYYPGQMLNGRIEYTLDTPKQVRGISVKFKGEASTTISRSTCRKTLHYEGNELYFNSKYYIIGSDRGDPIDVPIGKNLYSFSCQLPPKLPTSFEGELGFVRYTIKVTLDRPWKFDLDTKMAFTIVSNLDLNSEPLYRNPLRLVVEKSFGCCCCPSGHVTVVVRLPVRGYCSGQTMPFDVMCQNNSKTSIRNVRIRLRKITIYRTQHPKMHSVHRTVDVGELSLGKVQANTTLDWKPILKIPPLPPSNLLHCTIIDIGYEIKMNCSPAGCHSGVDMSCPVFLGTIPLVDFQSPSPGAATSLKTSPTLPTPTGKSGTTNQSAPPPPYTSVVQLTYEECQFTAKSIFEPEDDKNMRIHGRKDFAPRYPTYGIAQTQ